MINATKMLFRRIKNKFSLDKAYRDLHNLEKWIDGISKDCAKNGKYKEFDEYLKDYRIKLDNVWEDHDRRMGRII